MAFDREIEKFIIRQPPIGEKDDYDSENSWISDGLPSSSIWSGHMPQWSFAWPLPWLLSYRPFPVPQYSRFLHAWLKFIAWRVSLLIANSVVGSCSLRFLSLSITKKYVYFTLIYIAHQAVNSCTMFSSFCMPSGVSAKIEILSMNPILLNW